MLREPNLSLEQAIRLGQSAEETQKRVKALKQDAEISKINHTYSYSPNQNSHSASNPTSDAMLYFSEKKGMTTKDLVEQREVIAAINSTRMMAT